MLGKCAFVECPCEDGKDVAVAASSSCKMPVHHMCSNNIHECELNVRVCSNDCCVALGLKKPSSGPTPTSVAFPVVSHTGHNSTGAHAKAKSKVGVASALTKNVATPVRHRSPRRDSLDANTPSQDRSAQGPNPRPSPYQRRSPRLELLRETASSHDPLIKLSVDVRLKNTVNQRLSSSGRIGTHSIQCDTWDEVKTKLWDIIQRELKPLAVLTGTPPVWTVDEHAPAIKMFEKYMSMGMNTKMLDPWTSAKDRRYLSKNQRETVLLSVYRYGNEISTVGHLADFEDQCIGPAATDRGGAATEELHQLMICSLKEKWGATFTAQDISWRLWASFVIKKPRPQHEREIAKGPPPNLVTQFRPASNASDQHLQRVQRSVKMTKKVVQGMQAKIKHFEQTVQVLHTSIVSMNQMLENHMDVIEALGEDVVIQPDSTEVTSALTAIPNREDVDHA